MGSVACTGIEQETEKPDDSEKPLPLTLDVSISEVTENTAYVNIETSHDESTYYASVIAKADYNRLGDDKALLEEDKEFFKYLARKEGKSYEQVIDFMLNTGSQEERFINLISDTEYYAYAYEMNADGEVTGGITKAEFKTEKQQGEPITFQMRMEEYRDKYAAVYVTPSTDTAWCVTGFLTKSAVAQYGGSIQAIKLFAMEYLLSQAEFGGLDMESIVDIFCSRGEFMFEEDQLVPETSYYAYVVAVDIHGRPISDVEVLEFETSKEGMIGFDIQIEVRDHIGSSVEAEFTTSDGKNKYVYMNYPSDFVESFETDEELQEWIVNDYGYSLRYWLVNGNQKSNFTGLLPGSDYYAIAFGFSEENEAVTTPLFKKKFTAPVPENVSFEITVEMVKMGALVTVYPSDNLTPYVSGFVDKAEYDKYGGSMEELFKGQIDAYMKKNPDMTQEQAIKSFTDSGQEFFTRQYLYSNTQYYFWVAMVNRECEFVGEPAIKEFTSKEHVLNDDYVTVESAFYDGAELAEMTFLYRDYADYAVLHVNVTPSAEGVAYVPWVYAGDLENNTEEYTDEIIRYDLINYKSSFLTNEIVYIIPWDTEFTLCVATVNGNLECGKVYRKAMTLKKEDAAPAEEFSALYEYPTFPNLQFGFESIRPSYAESVKVSNRNHVERNMKVEEKVVETCNDFFDKLDKSEMARFEKKMVKERLF